jgi:hypothetical protein
MPLATKNSLPILQPLDGSAGTGAGCYITANGINFPSGGGATIYARVLPEITDSKSANYSDEPIMGRSFPAKTFGHGENRVINVKWHFVLLQGTDAEDTLEFIRFLQSMVYPMNSPAPYAPPPIVTIQCGSLLANEPLCAIVKSYSLNYPTDVPWDANTYLPYKFDMDLNLEVVFQTSQLPGQEDILKS